MGDGLGGTPRPNNHQSTTKTSEMTEKATWKNSDRSTSGEKGGVDLRNAKNKETRDSGEQITLKGREYGSPLNEVPISNSNLTAFHTDNVAFEMQIQELDSEISKFDKATPRDRKFSFIEPRKSNFAYLEKIGKRQSYED
nr:hypothetical protein CFP56_75848 [Quercus suber]